MKQNITKEQAREISKEQWYKLIQFFMKSGEIKGELPLWFPLSIGQMIEFLDEHALASITLDVWIDRIGQFRNRPELCDLLWEAVKQVLEEYEL